MSVCMIDFIFYVNIWQTFFKLKMKKTVIKPTFGCGDYHYKDPYSSHLKSMQEKCKSMLRPTWNKTDFTSSVDYQQLFKQLPDLDITQYYFFNHL